MKKIRHRKFLLALMIIFLLVAGPLARAGGPGRCAVCGMKLHKYLHTRYVARTTDGKAHVTCGVQCGLTLHLRLKDKWESGMATDLLSGRHFDVRKGFYVHGSSVITDMAPGFIAFNKRINAEKFAKGFGGKVLTYGEALKIWGKLMK